MLGATAIVGLVAVTKVPLAIVLAAIAIVRQVAVTTAPWAKFITEVIIVKLGVAAMLNENT